MAGGPDGGRGVALGDIEDDGAVGLDRDGRLGVTQGELGGVVFFGQMREPDRVRAVVQGVFAEQSDGGLVRQMAVVAENAGLQVAGVLAARESMDIVVRFQHQQVRPANGPADRVGDMAEIRQVAGFLAAWPVDDVDADGVGGIMRHGERLDLQIPDAPLVPDRQDQMRRLRLAPVKRRERLLRRNQRDPVALGQRMSALNMVGMLVRDDRPAEVARRQSLLGQRRHQLSHPHPGINQQRNVARANQRRIAGRSRSERMDSKRRTHAPIVPEAAELLSPGFR